MGGPTKFADAIATANAPTDFVKSLRAAGIEPGSAIGRQLIQQNLFKQNYVAPVNARPGSILRDPGSNMPVAFNPHVPEGTSPVFDAGGNVSSFQPIGNAEAAIGLGERARAFGKGQATPSVAYDANNRPVFSTVAQDVVRAQPGVMGAFDTTKATPEAISAAIAQIKDPQERANAQAAFDSQMRANPSQLTPQLRPGAAQGATLSQDELSSKGKQLLADNANANTVISRLQNIKLLAPGAIAGAETGRRDFFNGLLSLAGIKGAEDAKTASDLLDKNQSQIVSALRMGQGGTGTDALQTLLGAANPNRHMTKEAIQEAADQLIASQRMLQDKAKVLQDQYLTRDPIAYGKKEIQFDQNADPRVWQLQSMSPQQQAVYVKSLPPDMAADLLKKRQELKKLGVF
jgi:hypothetical protein